MYKCPSLLTGGDKVLAFGCLSATEATVLESMCLLLVHVRVSFTRVLTNNCCLINFEYAVPGYMSRSPNRGGAYYELFVEY